MSESAKNIVIGIAVTVLSTLILGGLSKLGNISIFHLIGGKVVWQDPQVAVKQSVPNSTPPDVILGEHDICTLSKVNIQSKQGWGLCSLERTGKIWVLHASQGADPGAQAVCEASCVDIR
jgi:hypothetical protein